MPQSESGIHVDFTGFTLCFISVLLLSSGLFLICLSIWSIVRKAPYYIVLNVTADVPYFTLPAGILCCSSFWIAASLHNRRENYRFLHLLLVLVIISLLFIIIGISLGMMCRSTHVTTGYEMAPMNWDNFNKTLENAFANYSCNAGYRKAWNKIHSQLQCCGLRNKSDWQKPPPSCCNYAENCYAENAYSRGCLDALKRDLLWQKSFLNAHCYIVGILEGLIVIVSGTLYSCLKM